MNTSELDFGWVSMVFTDSSFMLRVGVAVLLVSLWWLITTRLNARDRRERQELMAQMDNLRNENRSVVELAVRNGRRLKQLENQLRQMSTNVEASNSSAQLAELPHAYDQAIRLARRGADAAKLVSDMGLSLGEAELVVRLHGDRKTG